MNVHTERIENKPFFHPLVDRVLKNYKIKAMGSCTNSD